MKSIGELMKELGFNKEAPESVKEAFIKNLIKRSIGVEFITPLEKIESEQQLCFDFFQDQCLKDKRVS